MQRLCLLMLWRHLRRACPAGRFTLPAPVGVQLLPRRASICVLRAISQGVRGLTVAGFAGVSRSAITSCDVPAGRYGAWFKSGYARGSGVSFGRRVCHLAGRGPKKTPDPFRVATPERADLNQARYGAPAPRTRRKTRRYGAWELAPGQNRTMISRAAAHRWPREETGGRALLWEAPSGPLRRKGPVPFPHFAAARRLRSFEYPRRPGMG